MATTTHAATSADFPPTIQDFLARFETEEACRGFLAETRWGSGFECPKCGDGRAYRLANRDLWKCRGCRKQISLTSGTLMHKSQQPLRLWFHAAYLVASRPGGISARELQHELGLKRYDTAWTMLQKLRQAMGPPSGDRLTGTVEVDVIPLKDLPGRPVVRQEARKNLFLVAAVEVRGRGMGRVRMELLPDLSASSLVGFVQETVVPGSSTILTGNILGYQPLQKRGYERISVVPPGSKSSVRHLPRVHRLFAQFQDWLASTYHQVGLEHIERYVDEFVFHHNSRHRPVAGLQALLGQAASIDGSRPDRLGRWVREPDTFFPQADKDNSDIKSR
ncbi:MAG TPA: IS1595 family transposase [Deltaproteobacteria bacterium]|nr:IS1595 family transposase [Deltaproteobacteria bacterium]HCP48110.1 IS1595 family transposase [Deltaproteobacteria bacterium]